MKEKKKKVDSDHAHLHPSLYSTYLNCVYAMEVILCQTFLFNYLIYLHNVFNVIDLLAKTADAYSENFVT